MTRRLQASSVLCGLAVLLAAGCAHPISEALRRKAAEGPPFAAVLANPEAHKGVTVMWGGVIIETLNRKDGTDITVLETPLDSLGKPTDARRSRGRFVVHSPRFLDPEIYKKELKITVGGQVVGQHSRPLGQIQYVYPVVEASELHLWPKETDVRYYPRYHIGFGTWYHPYWGYYGRDY